jgi:hypothetical protein
MTVQNLTAETQRWFDKLTMSGYGVLCVLCDLSG